MANINTTCIYDEETGRYIVKGARILFPNFEGAEQDYNQAGKRNFRLQLTPGMAEELKGRGLYVRERPSQDDTEDDQYLVKIGVYADADVRTLSGRHLTQLHPDDFYLVDQEMRKGHVKNGEIDLEFHISRNTRVSTSSPYARLDTIIVPIRKSRLLADYENMEDDNPFDAE